MPVKDYAKRSSHRKPKKKSNALWFPVMIIALAGLISLITYMAHSFHTKHEKAIATKEPATLASTAQHKTANTTKKIIPISDSESQAEFDFYTLLPEMEVSVPQPETTAIQTGKESYLLQIASVRNAEDAKRLRDKLQSMGLMASVQTYRSTTGTLWHRVIAGPYSDLKSAEDDQDKLLDERLDSLLLRNKI